ncbi:UNVERIFIED_CONTAM: Retrovirus-related Pol polyprotein from transposon RE1 [Sesamum radiatum]|uniref:Retrovirus-related Pol polyprotein from transposon RE1 n=1 Tax=Sesamum radiatum TaxID=300843 RepID=A0AAW2KRM7_SESRA
MATTEDGGRENVTAANSGGRRDMETPEFLQLHGGDHPGMVLVSAPFDGTDFLAWRRSMVIALRAKMKLGFIDGQYSMPDKTSDSYENWIRMDSMVMSWILNAISKKISKAFLYTKSSRQLWLDLEERYGESNGPLVYQLQRAIASIRQGTHTVIEYFNNLTSLWDELDCLKPPKVCTCGLCVCGFTKVTAEEENLTKLVQFLMGLDDSYDSIRNQILVMDPFPSVNKAYAMVLRIERQRMINAQTGENVDNVALHTKWNDSRSNTGSRGVLQNLNKGGYKGKGLIDKRTQICTNCGKTGHTKDTCFKLHGVPDWYRDMKEQRRGETGPARGFNVVSGEGNINTDGSNNFGETMKQMAELMKMMRKTCHSKIPCKLTLHTEKTLQDLETKDILAVGRVLGGLYILDKASFNPTYIQRIPVPFISSKCNMSSTVGDNWLWHQRLGHPSLPVIQHIKSIKAFGSWICVIYVILPNKNDFLFHLMIFRVHSRAVWVFLLQNKTQVFSKLSSFLNSVQTQFHTQVKIVRSDNGSEFVNFSCHDLFQSLGIIHQKSCPHTPQQNGIVERKHQHLLNMARSLMHQASLPRYFWGECILTAAYLINRLPSSVLQWKTPYEILYHKPPFLDHLRIFGCLCYATNVLPHKDKFDSRASKCVLVGYSQNQKGYRLFHLTDKVIFTSRDVYFHENYFPFSHITHSPTSYLPTPAIDSTSYTHPNSAPVDSITPNPEPNVPETPTLNLSPAHTPVLRRSQRHVNQPLWLQDFICHNASSTPFHSCDSCSFSPAHMSFLAQVDAVQEPRSFTEANRSSHWREAMEKELEALEKNSTWDLTELPAGKRAIGSRWVYKTKLNQDGSIERYKARLVAKGYTQIEGVDFFDSFSPVAKTVTVRIFIAVATAFRWPLLQLDVNNAFLHGHLEEEVYMVPPEGYNKAHGGNSLPALDAVKHYLDDLFTIKDLGNAKYFLGLELARSNQGTYVTQRKYLLDIVHDCHLDDAKATTTPLPAGIKFDASSGPCLASPERYRRLVGRLLYLGFSRPDISFAVQQLSQFIQCPRQPHWDAALYLVLLSFPGKPRNRPPFLDLLPAEYRSMGSTVCELLWIGYILAEFGISLDSPIPFYCDNKAAIHITENPVFHERTKHLDIDCHLVRDQFKRGFILPQHVSSQHQPADLFTKSLPASPFARLVSKLGMLSHAPT